MTKETKDKFVTSRLSIEDKQRLSEITQNNNITVRDILEDFIKEYCSTKPKGIKLKIKDLENELLEIQEQRNLLDIEETKLNIQLKTYKDSLNKTLDSYIDEDLNNAVESISKIINDNNYTSFEDIKEISFIKIAKYNRIDIKDLKLEVKKLF